MKSYLLKLTKELHAKVKAASAVEGLSMLDFIIAAIEEKIERGKK